MLMFIGYNCSHSKLCMIEHYNSLRIYFGNDIKDSFVCYIFPQAELSESYVNNNLKKKKKKKKLTLIRSMQGALYPYTRHSLNLFCFLTIAIISIRKSKNLDSSKDLPDSVYPRQEKISQL